MLLTGFSPCRHINRTNNSHWNLAHYAHFSLFLYSKSLGNSEPEHGGDPPLNLLNGSSGHSQIRVNLFLPRDYCFCQKIHLQIPTLESMVNSVYTAYITKSSPHSSLLSYPALLPGFAYSSVPLWHWNVRFL